VNGKIAIEEHFVTPELLDTIFPNIGWDQDEWQLVTELLQETDERRLQAMDAGGIQTSVLSLTAPCIQDIVGASDAVSAARHANDALAEIVRRSPDRYAGFAALPLQDPSAAAAELERAVGDLGFRGAMANGYSSVGDLSTAAYYDEPQYQEFWERVAALDVPFYLHPRNPLPTERRIYQGREELLGPTWAFTMETATHALRLMTSGLFDRVPTLQIILGHMGELLPFALDRTQQRLEHIPSVNLERSTVEYFRDNFYITTSGNFHTPSLLGAIDQVGLERILFAVDYPYEQISDAVDWFDGLTLGQPELEQIGRGNAQRLLGL
jgi:predicted TIM-barrel fold metal-dependent hydrolase